MFVDCSINSTKLQLVSEPWDDTDYSYKNRATLSVFVDELNCGFSSFLNHPSELLKKIKVKSGKEINLSSMPIQVRMDRIKFTIIMDSLMRLTTDKEYMGITMECMNYWYDSKGDVILTDGKKKPCHTSTVKTGRDADGVIFIAVKEEKHPEKEARPGAIFKFNTGNWFKIKDNNTSSELSKAKDSIENTRAFVKNWQDAVFKCLDNNYKLHIERKKKQQEEYKAKQSGGQQTSNPDAWK